MADTATSSRVEPSIEAMPVSAAIGSELRTTAEPRNGAGSMAEGGRFSVDQLARIEDKTARIEEKFARSEALLQRVGSLVETATGRMQEVASQSDLAALRKEVSAISAQVRRLPGKTALVSVAIVTSLLTAAIVLVLIRYGLPR